MGQEEGEDRGGGKQQERQHPQGWRKIHACSEGSGQGLGGGRSSRYVVEKQVGKSLGSVNYLPPRDSQAEAPGLDQGKYIKKTTRITFTSQHVHCSLHVFEKPYNDNQGDKTRRALYLKLGISGRALRPACGNCPAFGG